MPPEPPDRPPLPQRKHPAHGVLIKDDEPTIVFVTVCTKDRNPWLATEENHELLRSVWAEGTAWHVGRYVVMPDHIHLFAAPGIPELELRAWIRYWKSQFSKRHGNRAHRWQTDGWDTRLRRSDSYDEKWEYVSNNPVRHSLVANADDWPFQGVLFDLRW